MTKIVDKFDQENSKSRSEAACGGRVIKSRVDIQKGKEAKKKMKGRKCGASLAPICFGFLCLLARTWIDERMMAVARYGFANKRIGCRWRWRRRERERKVEKQQDQICQTLPKKSL